MNHATMPLVEIVRLLRASEPPRIQIDLSPQPCPYTTGCKGTYQPWSVFSGCSFGCDL